MEFLYAYFIYYGLAAIGITYGYHRYFAHKEFKASPFMENVMLLCGLLCGGRSVLTWAAVHRMHHAYADTHLDPHSPLHKEWHEVLFSFWSVKRIPRKFVKDLLRNPRVMFFHKYGKFIWLGSILINWKVWLVINILSYLGFGLLNLFGHKDGQPVNRVWLNLIAPFEGNHEDHHVKSR